MPVLKTISPIDGRVIVERSLAEESEVNHVLKKSKIAGDYWQYKTLDERQDILSKAVDLLVADTENIARDITLQMGRPILHSPAEVKGAEKRARYMINCATEALAVYQPENVQGFKRYIAREPVGCILIVAPWNYPLLTAINCIIPALVAGNSIILKHSAQTPLCAERLQHIFLEAGVPEGVFQYLHISHEHTEHLIRDHRIAFVNFTGSVKSGRIVQQAARRRFIDIGLELGGKDPAWVREDASLPYAVEQLVDGVFFNSGQSCCGVERIYVHRQLFDDFVQKFIARAHEYILGNPLELSTTLGPMVKSNAADFVRGQVKEAILQGAKSLIPESDFPMSEPGSAYLAPQVLINVNHDMRLMTEESFGPVVGIMPVDSDQEAIALMNDSDFGLTASVWTSDDEAAIHIGNQLETGTFFMNRCDYLDPTLVWTGVKDTGRGKSLSVYGYDAVTRLKSYHLKLEQQ